MNYLLIFLGGGLGSVARFGISQLFGNYAIQFPIATFITNILSCIILGIALYLVKIKSGSEMSWFLITGFCGGFSTFSTFSLETFQLLQSGHFFYAGLNVVSSILLCIAIIYLIYKLN